MQTFIRKLFLNVLHSFSPVLELCITSNLDMSPQITVKLDLRNNNLQELSRGAFILTPYLTHLNLQRCNIIRVKEGAFRTLGRVVSLNLAYNKIETLYQVVNGGRNGHRSRLAKHFGNMKFPPSRFFDLTVAGVLRWSLLIEGAASGP